MARTIGCGIALWLAVSAGSVGAETGADRELGDRLNAIEALAECGMEAVPDLIALLGDPEPRIRRHATLAIGVAMPDRATSILGVWSNGPDGRPQDTRIVTVDWETQEPVAALAGVASDPDPSVRLAAVQALSKVGPGNHGWLDAMVTRTRDDDPHVRATAAEGLGRITVEDQPEADVENAAAVLTDLIARENQIESDSARSIPASIQQRKSWPWREFARELVPAGVPPRVTAIKALVNRRSYSWSWGPESIPGAAEALRAAARSPNQAVWAAATEGLRADSATNAEVARLVNSLGDDDKEVRRTARDGLERLQGAALAPLEEALDHANEALAIEAVDVISRLKPKAKAAGSLTRAVRNERPAVRLRAAVSLWPLVREHPEVGVEAGVALTEIASVFNAGTRTGDARARSGAIKALGDLVRAIRGEPEPRSPQSEVSLTVAISTFTAALTDPARDARQAAVGALSGLQPDDRVFAALTAALFNPDSAVRYDAARSLFDAGGDFDRVADMFVRALAHPDPGIRHLALARYRWRSTLPDEALVPLVRLLDDPNEDVRKGLGDLLWRLSDLPAEAVAIVVRAVDAADPELRIRAIDLLLRSIDCDPSALAAIVGALRHFDPTTRERAIAAVESLGVRAIDAVPALIDELAAPDPSLHEAACRALKRIGPAASAAIPALGAALSRSEWRTAREATVALGVVGMGSERAERALLAALPSAGADGAFMVRALAAIGARSDATVAGLTNAARGHESASTRIEAIELLARFGPAVAVPILIEALADCDGDVRAGARKAFMALDPDWLAYVPALATTLDADEAWIRRDTADALGALLEGAAAAEPALARRLADADPRGRQATFAALRAIRARSSATVQALLDFARTADDKTVIDVYALISQAGAAGAAAIPRLIRDVAADRPQNTREAAAAALAALGPVVRDHLAEIRALHGNEIVHGDTSQSQVAHSLARTIANMGADTRPILFEWLRAQAVAPRLAAIQALSTTGTDNAENAAAVATAFALDDEADVDKRTLEELRGAVVGFVVEAKAGADVAVPLFIRCLRDEICSAQEYIANRAIARLADLGGDAVVAIPELLAQLRLRAGWNGDGGWDGTYRAAAPVEQALIGIRVPAAAALTEVLRQAIRVPPSGDLWEDPDSMSLALMKHRAVRTLGRMGGDARVALPELRAILATGEPLFKVETERAIDWIEHPEHAEVVPFHDVVECISSRDCVNYIETKQAGRAIARGPLELDYRLLAELGFYLVRSSDGTRSTELQFFQGTDENTRGSLELSASMTSQDAARDLGRRLVPEVSTSYLPCVRAENLIHYPSGDLCVSQVPGWGTPDRFDLLCVRDNVFVRGAGLRPATIERLTESIDRSVLAATPKGADRKYGFLLPDDARALLGSQSYEYLKLNRTCHELERSESKAEGRLQLFTPDCGGWYRADEEALVVHGYTSIWNTEVEIRLGHRESYWAEPDAHGMFTATVPLHAGKNQIRISVHPCNAKDDGRKSEYGFSLSTEVFRDPPPNVEQQTEPGRIPSPRSRSR